MDAPLAGLLVLDFGRVIAAPRCARYLADLGAEVIHIERPGQGDDTRSDPHIFQPGWSGAFLQENWGKRSLCVDLKHPRAGEIIDPLVRRADIVIENFRPGVARSLGLGYERLRGINPAVIMCSISAYGQEGPFANRVGYGFMADALAAIPEMTGEPGGPPMPTALPLADSTTSMLAFGLIATALFERARTGVGRHIDVALLDAAFALHDLGVQTYLSTGGQLQPTRRGLLDDMRVPWGYFQGADGWMCIICGTEAHWQALAAAMERPDLKDRYRSFADRVLHKDEIYEAIGAWVASFPGIDQPLALLAEAQVPCARLNTIHEAINHPQVQERRLIRDREHPVLGKVRIQNFLGINAAQAQDLPAPGLGEHNRLVATEIAGLGEEHYLELLAEGCISGPGD